MSSTLEATGSAEDQTRHITFEGLSDTEVAWIRHMLASTGLPLAKIKFVKYQPEHEDSDTAHASASHIHGRIRIHNPFFGKSSRSQLRILAHEIAHILDPQLKKNTSIFGSRENISHARGLVDAVANQALLTGVYLSKYHADVGRELAECLDENQTRLCFAESDRYMNETWAILVGMRYVSSKKLQEVQERQRGAIGSPKNFVDFITQEGESEPVGIDEVLISMLRDTGLRTLQDLNNHIDGAQSKAKLSGPLTRAPLN